MGRAHLLPVEICTVRKRKCNSTLSATLQREPLQLEGGVFSCVEGLGKFLQVILRNLCFLLRPQPDEQPRQNAANQLKSLLDRYPVCLE
jgi:hypothetical protein